VSFFSPGLASIRTTKKCSWGQQQIYSHQKYQGVL